MISERPASANIGRIIQRGQLVESDDTDGRMDVALMLGDLNEWEGRLGVL